MGCRPLVNEKDQVVGHICGGESRREYRAETEIKWCFNCRRYNVHRWGISIPDSPWYGPNQFEECVQCHGDYTLFWGLSYEYDE